MDGGIVFLRQPELIEEPYIQNAQHRNDAAQENDQNQQQSGGTVFISGGLCGAGLPGIGVPGIIIPEIFWTVVIVAHTYNLAIGKL